MRRWGPLIIATWLLVGCTQGASTSTSTTSPSPTSTTSTTTASNDVCATGDLPFVEDGLVVALGDEAGDAQQIAQISWEPTATCERLIISFATDSGAPATGLGPTGVTTYAFDDLITVTLPPGITATAVADTVTDGRIIDRVYVVRDEAGAMSIDIVGSGDQPFAVRAFVTAAPVALVIDVVPDTNRGPTTGIARSDSAVIVTPSSGPSLYPFIVSAYAQPGLRSVTMQVTADDDVAIDRTIALAGDSDAWQGFETRIEDGPSGPAVLFVGTVDANARPVVGATVSLDLP